MRKAILSILLILGFAGILFLIKVISSSKDSKGKDKEVQGVKEVATIKPQSHSVSEPTKQSVKNEAQDKETKLKEWQKRYEQEKEKFRQIVEGLNRKYAERKFDEEFWKLHTQRRQLYSRISGLILHDYPESGMEKLKLHKEFGQFYEKLKEKGVEEAKRVEQKRREEELDAYAGVYDQQRLEDGYIPAKAARNEDPLKIAQYLWSDNYQIRSWASYDLNSMKLDGKFNDKVRDELVRIARDSPYSDAQFNALDLLLAISNYPNQPAIQELLKEIVVGNLAKSEQAKVKVLLYIKDEKILREILENKKYSPELRLEAASLLRATNYMLSMLKSEPKESIRYDVIRDLGWFFDVKGHIEPDVKERKMKPKGELVEIIETLKSVSVNDPSGEIRTRAKEAIHCIEHNIERSDDMIKADKLLDLSMEYVKNMAKTRGAVAESIHSLSSDISLKKLSLGALKLMIFNATLEELVTVEKRVSDIGYVKFFGKDEKYQEFERVLKGSRECLEKEKEKYLAFEDELKKFKEEEKRKSQEEQERLWKEEIGEE
jgi:hypothetical protein